MNRKWIQRLLCAIICLALLLADVPAGLDRAVADSGEAVVVEEVIPEEAAADDGEIAPSPGADLPPAEPEGDADSADQPSDEAPDEIPDEVAGDEGDPLNGAEPEDAISGWIEALDAQALSGDYSRALWLYDLVIASFEPGDAQDAASALADGSAAPLGYALAYEELLNAAGIECLTVTGANSAWNIARLDGGWAHIDAYADDAPDCYGTHFGLSDAAMARDHRWDGDYPACDDLSNSYFVRERGYAAYVDVGELRALLNDAISSGARELYLLNASEEASVEDALTALLAELDSGLAASVSEKGCYAAVLLEEVEDSAPELVEPEATAPAIFAPEPEAPEIIAVEPVEEQTEVSSEHTEVASDAALLDAIAPSAEGATGTITPSVESLTLGVGETARIEYTLSSGAGDSVRFTSKYESIASVDGEGNVTARKVGRTVIALEAEPSGARCEVEVAVKEVPASIALRLDGGDEYHEITGDSLVLGQGDAATLRATVEPKSAAGAIHWTFDPLPYGVHCEPDGGELKISVSGDAAADAAFTVAANTYEAGISSQIAVRVVAAPEDGDLKISLDKTELGVGQEIDPQFGYSDSYSAANDAAVPFHFAVEGKSGKNDIFARDAATGKYVAKYAGNATLSMIAYNGARSSVEVAVKAAPTGVSVKLPVNILCVGEEIALSPATGISVSGKNVYTGDVTLYSKNEDIVSVEPNAEGEGWTLAARKAGTAKLYAKTYNGKQSKDVSITVSDVPTTLELSQTEDVTLAKGEKIKLKATILPKGRTATVSWSCEPEDAFSYNAKTGEWTATGNSGDAVITASLPNGDSQSVRVHLKRAVFSTRNFRIAFKADQKQAIGIGEATALEVQFADESGEFTGEPIYSGAVSWSVDATTKKKGYATVKDGVVTGKKAGAAVVTANVNGIQRTQTVPILSKPAVTFETAAKSVSMAAGETISLGARISSGYTGADENIDKSNLISFRSSNAKVVEVSGTPTDSEGNSTVTVTAMPDAAGKSAKIYATPVGGSEISLSVAVSPALESIALADANLAAGESLVLKPALEPANATPNLAWRIEEPSDGKLTIDEQSGEIAADADAAAGTKYTVTVTAAGCADAEGNSLRASCEVAVKNLPGRDSRMRVAVEKQVGRFDADDASDGAVSIGVGEKLNGSVVYEDADTAGSVAWSSDNEKAVKVDAASGVITGVKAGTANITATSIYGSASASIEVTVCGKSKPSGIAFSKSVAKLGAGESFAFEVKDNYAGDGSWYTLSSDNSQILRVAQDGRVTAVAEGAASVTATSYTGSKKSVKITVLPAPAVTGDGKLQIPAEVKLARGDKLCVKADFGGGYANLDWTVGTPEGAEGITVAKKSNEEIEISAKAGASVAGDTFTIPVHAYGYAGTSKELSTIAVRLVDGYGSSGEMGTVELGKATIGVGETTQASVTPNPGASTGGSYKWSSSNSKIASVSSAGVVKGVKAGTAAIYATAFNSKKNALIRIEKKVTVVAAPSLSVEVNGKKQASASIRLGLGETYRLQLLRTGYAGADVDPTGLYQPVATGDEAIVRVDESELDASDVVALTGLAPGSTTVTVKTYNNKSVKLTVSVAEEKLAEIQVSGFSLAKGDSVAPEVKFVPEGSFANLEWSIPAGSGLSEKGGVISADKDAQAGSAVNVSVQSIVDGAAVSRSFTVTVANPPTAKSKLTVQLPKAKIAVGETVPATVGFETENTAGTMKWTTSSSKIAKISPASGESTAVTGVKAGKATITAKAFNSTSYNDSEAVQVVAAPASIDFKQGEALGVFPGGSYDLDVRLPESYQGDVLPKEKESQETLFRFQVVSGGAIIESLDERSGVVEIADEADPNATAKISVTTCDGKQRDELTIIALDAPASVALMNGEATLETLDIAEGERFTPTVLVRDAEGKAMPGAGVQWAVSDNSCVQVDPATGELTALKAMEDGAAPVSVTASAQDKSASYRVIVHPAPTVDSLEFEADRRLPVDASGNITLGTGETAQVSFRFADDVADQIYNKKVEFSGNKGLKYAGVESAIENPDGSCTLTVKGKKAGSETITAKTAGGLEKSLSFKVVKAPTSIALNVDRTALGVGERMELSCTLSSGSSSVITYAVSDEGVAKVEEKEGKSGEIEYELVALTTGKIELTAATFNNKVSKPITIEVLNAPESIEVNDPLTVGIGAKAKLHASVNEGSAGKLRYELTSDAGLSQAKIDAIATIDEDGNISANGLGELTVHLSTYVEGVTATAKLQVKHAPEAIYLKENYAIEIGETDPHALQILPDLEPEDSATTLTYSYSNKSYFTIDDEGYVTPLAQKEVSQDVTVKTHNFVSAKQTPKLTAKTKVWVVKDLNVPKIIRLAESTPVYVNEGETRTPELYVFPEEADRSMTWKSSNTDIATVDDDGAVTGVSFGFVTITGTSDVNSKLKVSYKLIVLSKRRCLKMPEHRIEKINDIPSQQLKSRIQANLDQIEEVHQSAIMELEQLVKDKVLAEKEKETRKKYIDKAFGMFSIPWRPNKLVGYWKAANSVGGRKNFNTTTVYFGLPYTQSNRKYDLGSFMHYCGSKTAEGYYIAKLASRDYPGNDCSSFVSMAIWGGHDTTSAIASNGRYKTMGNWYDLRPGDLLCKGGSHVVMFLYYVNKACDQFVVIEQGGGGDDPYSNCVSTSLRTQSYYKNGGYKIRRVNGLNTTTHDRRDYM